MLNPKHLGYNLNSREQALPKQIHECVLLHVEDDDASAYLFQTALRESGFSPRLFRVTDGDHAMDFLLRNPPFGDSPRPDLVLLDLNLPRRNGFEVLEAIKSNQDLRGIQVVVFSTSDSLDDRDLAAQLGAEGYLTKEGDFAAFVNAAQSVCCKLA